jgi:Icc protein
LLDKIVIAQITDIHIGSEDKLYNDIDVRLNFLKVLKDLENHKIDYIVLSGDLAIDFGEIEAYKWIKSILVDYPIPVLFMAGNHDSVDRMRQIFNIENEIKIKIDESQKTTSSLYYKKTLNNLPIIFLDSEPDSLSFEQLIWLQNELKEDKREHLLFIHHPPCLCDCSFMDRKYSLRNIEQTQLFLNNITNVRHIFVGHYHADKVVMLGNKNIYITPATQMQISTTNSNFEISDYRPGWRKIEWNGTELKTEVLYVE